MYTNIVEGLKETCKQLRNSPPVRLPSLSSVSSSRNSIRPSRDQSKSNSSTKTTSDIKPKVLLFHISTKSRSLIEMLSIAYFLGKGEMCIICIKELPTKAIIDGELLSPKAVKDYNRGRAYLADLAQTCGNAEVYTDIREAVKRYLVLHPHPTSCNNNLPPTSS